MKSASFGDRTARNSFKNFRSLMDSFHHVNLNGVWNLSLQKIIQPELTLSNNDWSEGQAHSSYDRTLQYCLQLGSVDATP